MPTASYVLVLVYSTDEASLSTRTNIDKPMITVAGAVKSSHLLPLNLLYKMLFLGSMK
jgi:hypothetical protein